MKWKNKGHELDMVAEKLLEDKEKFKHIYIFGAGVTGVNLIAVMQSYGILKGFIDNDRQKQHKGCQGYPVYSIGEYTKLHKGLVVIAASDKNVPVIEKQLAAAGLLEGEDFVSHAKFCGEIFPIVSVYLFDKVYVDAAQISLTERCSLKCKKCAHGCFAVDNRQAKDLTVRQMYKVQILFFDKVDFVHEFVLIGGEPLLYRQLPEAVRYIGERYRKQIGTFLITTNGTILPEKETLELCRNYNVLFRISNYSVTLPGLKDTYRRLVDLLDKNKVAYELGPGEREWMDYGFDYVDRSANAAELTSVFDACRTLCREIRENRYYFCVMARSVSENMGFNAGKHDYLDLDTITGKNYKKELLEFNLGYSEKGYLDMCNYCHGADSINYPIPAAEQVNAYRGEK